MAAWRPWERQKPEKGGSLYDFIDQSEMFHNPVAKEDRSIMNVIFTLPTQEDTKAFFADGRRAGDDQQKGTAA